MTRKTSRRFVYSSLLGLLLLGASSAMFVSCTTNDHPISPTADCRPPRDHKHHEHKRRSPALTTDGGPPDVIYCRGDSDCTDSEWFPICGDYEAVSCIQPPNTGSKECAFRLDYDDNCFCVERDIRACTTSSNTQGIQHCVATGDWDASWGGCGST